MNRNTFWWRLVHLDPVLFRSAIVAVITLLAMFGILVSNALPDALTAVVTTLGALIAAVWSRDGVAPMDKVVLYQPDPVSNPNQTVAGPATASVTTTDAKLVSEARRTGP